MSSSAWANWFRSNGSEATLSDPLPGDDVRRQWVYRCDPPDGTHEVVVRAVDGTGERQTEESDDSSPSGATGWVSKELSP
ncbi:hypothetical protein BRD00_12085 [Halobacteriales archaeon QS_8_69_26]|nr:MAG: hypothetical protein BRD00_12085 [Halobacteriales archaeon QS_8_69_26]